MKKIYCVFCGHENEEKYTKCQKCNKSLNPSENLWKDYLYNHIKDDLKDNVTDKVFSLVTNFIKSNLYGVIMTVLVLSTATVGIVNIPKNNNTSKYIKEVTVNNNLSKNEFISVKDGKVHRYTFVYSDKETCDENARGETPFDTMYPDYMYAFLGCEEVKDKKGKSYWGIHYQKFVGDELIMFYY